MTKDRWKLAIIGLGLGLATLAAEAGQCGAPAPGATPEVTTTLAEPSPTPSPVVAALGTAVSGTPAAGGIPAPYAGRRNPFTLDDPSAINEGALVYYGNCQFCHGSKGKGDGPSATGLVPPPTNLTVLEYLFANQPDREFWIVSEGIPGTAMPGFKDRLTEEQRWLALTYEWNLAKQANRQ